MIFSKEPLAYRMRPTNLEEYVGQEHILGIGKPLRRTVEEDKIHSMILWGPPGSGKTSLASLIALLTKSNFVTFSAVTGGVKGIREIVEKAEEQIRIAQKRTILFVDEIHHFNKTQQDSFLPHVEKGTVTLIGATTENPSFALNAALLSRCKTYILKPLEKKHILVLLEKTLSNVEKGLGDSGIQLQKEAMECLADFAAGDARRGHEALEMIVIQAQAEKIQEVSLQEVVKWLTYRPLRYDKKGDQHYDLISALHKSMRDSDVQASIYWATRMLEGGENPLYILRRLIRFSMEDIGLADPNALLQATSARDAYSFLGSPEGDISIIQCVIYLATAPKSNSVYAAENKTRKEIHTTGELEVPLVIRNAPTSLMKNLGYGEGYQYAPDCGGIVNQQHLPDEIKTKSFYEPGNFGFEREIKKRIEWWEKQKNS
ncbi:MAG: replication-associated recombination protein A [Candidatus Brocadiae bacterium]|nr:replication-associated recombination protein A [Candidatus Brocadiia bacterium]